MKVWLFILALLAPLLPPLMAHAHETTRSYLTITRDGAALTARFRVAFRDIEVAVWLDDDLDGQIIWAEAAARLPEIAAYVQANVQFDAGGPCELRQTGQGTSSTGGIAFLDLTFTGPCPGATAPLRITSRLFADIDPDHRLFLTMASGVSGASSATTMLGEHHTVVTQDAAPAGVLPMLWSFMQAGMTHLAGGADHIVFLIVLILPAIAMAGSPRQAVLGVLVAATGFTLAHAITLTAASLQLLRPRTDVIEALIALSIVVTAADNIRPFLPAPRAVVAAFFGLIHGFGFATALGGLPLSSGGFAVALLGFNLGIELAQIAIILLIMPALYGLRLGRPLVWAGSAASIAVGLYWAILRVMAWV